MSTAARKPPAPAGVRWRSVRGGLGLFVLSWSVLTLVAVSSRLWAMSASQSAQGADEQVAATVSIVLVGLIYQAVYSGLAVLTAIAAIRVTRAPKKSGAVVPALLSAIGFGSLVVVVLMLLSTSTTPADQRQLSETAISRLWAVAVVLRAFAVAAFGFALFRLARHLESPISEKIAGGLGALLVIDSAAAVWGALSPRALDGSSSGRIGLVVIQLVFAVLLIGVTVRVRRLTRPLAEKEERRELARAAAEPDPAEPEHQAPSAAPAAAIVEPDITPAARLAASVLVAIGAALLPLWDSLDTRLRFEIDAPAPALSAGLALAGVMAAILLFQALGKDAYRARLVLAGAALLGVAYAGMTLYTTAVQRSRLVDRFAVCESGEPPSDAMTRPMLSAVAGPHLENGVPCTRASERRAIHQEDHPNGSFQDGIAQIAKRFVADRNRMLGGSGIVLIAFLLAGLLVFRAAVEAEAAEAAEADDSGDAKTDPERQPQVPE